MKAQVWADGFGNWHAITDEEDESKSRTMAIAGIRTQLIARGSKGETFPELSVRMLTQNENQTEWCEWWPGDSGTVFPAAVTCGTCGRMFPDIYPSGRCPFEADHEEPEEDEETLMVPMSLGDARTAELYLSVRSALVMEKYPELSETLARVSADITNARIAAGKR